MEHIPPRNVGKAAVVIPYFGKFGPWFPLFLDSLSRQSTLDLLLVTDAAMPALPANARRVEMTLAELRARAEETLQTRVHLERPYKLCDLKPAYGLVFEEFLRGYDYWAFGDEDVFYGALDRLLAPRLAQRPDLVVPNYRMTIGHLTLVRNTCRLNRLVLEDSHYFDILADEANWRYDEAGRSNTHPSFSFTRTVKALEARGELGSTDPGQCSPRGGIRDLRRNPPAQSPGKGARLLSLGQAAAAQLELSVGG